MPENTGSDSRLPGSEAGLNYSLIMHNLYDPVSSSVNGVRMMISIPWGSCED